MGASESADRPEPPDEGPGQPSSRFRKDYGSATDGNRERPRTAAQAALAAGTRALAVVLGVGSLSAWYATVAASEFLARSVEGVATGSWLMCVFAACHLCSGGFAALVGADVSFWPKFVSGVALAEVGLVGLCLLGIGTADYEALFHNRLAFVFAAVLGCGAGLVEHAVGHLVCALDREALRAAGLSGLDRWEQAGRYSSGIVLLGLWFAMGSGQVFDAPTAIGPATVPVFAVAAVLTVIAAVIAFGPAAYLSPQRPARLAVHRQAALLGRLCPFAGAAALNQFATFAAVPALLFTLWAEDDAGWVASLALLVFVASELAGAIAAAGAAALAGPRLSLPDAGPHLFGAALARLLVLLLALALRPAPAEGGAEGRDGLAWLRFLAVGLTGGALRALLDGAAGPALVDAPAAASETMSRRRRSLRARARVQEGCLSLTVLRAAGSLGAALGLAAALILAGVFLKVGPAAWP
jgi:hypothetical protein